MDENPFVFQVSALGEKRFENPQTANLCKVLKDCECIIDNLKGLNKKLEQGNDQVDGGEEEPVKTKKRRVI